MKKITNPRSGHGPAFGIEIIYALIAMILGWPVTIPYMFLYEYVSRTHQLKLPFGTFYVCALVGAYFHYKLWAFLIGALKGWWNQ